jgi:tRNA(Ile)-lysidine synthetase-like protein
VGDTLEKVRAFIQRHQMLEGANGVLVAVSGGPDSVALLDMLASLNSGIVLNVAHLDHMLRGRGSGEDARFVRSLAKKLKLKSAISKVDVRARAKESKRGIEEVAREIRYEFLLRAARKLGCDRIAVGHTMNDQAETVLMRLVRGSGLRGLAGMRPVTPAHHFENVEWETSWPEEYSQNPVIAAAHLPSHVPLLIRPLLCITRGEVEAYCRDRKLDVRIDPSNTSREYTRNRFRSDVLSVLQELNPHVVERVAATAEIIAGESDALDHVASSLMEQTRVRSALPEDSSEAAAYSITALLRQPPGLRRRMLIKAIAQAREDSSAAKTTQIDRGHIEMVERLLTEGISGSRIVLPGGFEVWREFDALVLRQSALAPVEGDTGVEADSQRYAREISMLAPLVEAGGFNISLVRGQPGDLLLPAIEQARRERDRLGHDWMSAVLDDRLLPERLVVRPRVRGERVRALGHSRTKKLKNLMIDHRIPTSRRAIWPVVATPDGQYVWSPGLPPADEFAARDETHGLAILRASGV